MLDDAKQVCPTTTLRMARAGALLVDVRERDEVEGLAFDIPDLVVLPLSEFERRYAELPRDRELVVVCRSGTRSLQATYFLMHQGYTRVANMEGGIAKWARKGFPVKGNFAAAVAAPEAGCCCGSGKSTDAAAEPASSAGESCCASESTRAGACCSGK